MIDTHTHILPAVDDGSKSSEMSLEMLKMAVDSGITEIIATPHVMEIHTALAWQDIVSEVDKLQLLATTAGITIKVHPGAELEMNWELLDLFKSTDGMVPYGLAGSKYVLIELPASMIPSYADEFWFELRLCGLTPILAHPERHAGLMAKPEILNKWKKAGLLLQCNAGSLTGLYGSTAKKNVEYLIAQDYVDFMASDAHNNGRRNTDMSECIQLLESRFGREYKQRLLQANVQAILIDAQARACSNM